MRILHICLSNFYIDGFSYQENELVQQNVKDGHLVEIIASTETMSSDGKLTYISPGRYFGSDGAYVERVRYRRWLPHFLMTKLRMHPGIYKKIENFRPDVILFHCACGWEINAAGRYAKKNPHVKLYIDSHEDFTNSARTFISKWILHYFYYRPILIRNLPYVEKVLPVSISCLEFDRDFYGVPEEKIEFYPLGGSIPNDEEYSRRREATRQALGISSGQTLIVQSGKIDATKKLVEALQAFTQIPDPDLQFVVAGLLMADVQQQISALMAADPRIKFTGWQSAEQLRSLLCAADVYCQPGTQSATMQMSLACRCAVMLDEVSSHLPYMDDNGWLLGKRQDLLSCFQQISANPAQLKRLSEKSHGVALRLIDYRKLAARLYR